MPISAADNPLSCAVYVRADFAAAWTLQTDVDVISAEFAVAPAIPTAVLRRHYGCKREGGAYSVVAALDLRGKLVRIDLSDGTTTRSWYGYCPRQTDQVDATVADPLDGVTGRPTGTTTYNLVGNEYFLRQHVYDRCVTTAGVLRTAEPFNRRTPGRASLAATYRSADTTASAVATMDPFYRFDPDGTDEWSALDAAEHVMEVFARTYGMAVYISGELAGLANVKGAWDLDGMTFHAALCALIDPSRGFAWYMIDRTITVVSISDTALAGGLIPANPNVVTLSLDESAVLRAPVIQHVESSHYDEIEVQGEPVRVTFTMRYGWGSMDQGWTAAEETAYNAATAAATDKDANKRVFCRLELPEDWDQEANGENCMPVLTESDGSLDTASKQPLYLPALAVDRNLPLADADGHPQRPLVIVADGAVYRRVDNPGAGKARASVRVLEDAPGILLDPEYPHLFGKNHYTGGDTREKSYDWQDLYATVSMATPERLRIVKAAAAAEPGPVTKRKTIRVADAHLWYVVPGTVTDTDGATLDTHAGGYVRDDRAMLERIADLAAAWYGRRRSVIELPYNFDALVPRLGQVIRETYAGGSTVPTGTLITRESYDIDNRETVIGTDFFELNAAAVFGAGMGGGGSRTARRIESVERQLPNVPVRSAVPEVAASGGGAVPVQITAVVASPASFYGHKYTVSVYGDGRYDDAGALQSPTETGKTLFLLALASGTAVDVNTWLMATPVGDHYEATVPQWL